MPHPNILVVDDQLLSTRLLERRLVRSEMKVYSATNGTEGLKIAREVKPDVILLDIVMPGMDGISVCRELKKDKELKEIPVIFITARTGTQDKLEGFGVGAADFLVKPLNLEEAHARVKTQLRIIEEHKANLILTLGRRTVGLKNYTLAFLNLTKKVIFDGKEFTMLMILN